MSDQTTSNEARPQSRLMDLLQPILNEAAKQGLSQAREPDAVKALEAAMESAFPWGGEHVQAVGEEIARGVTEGWLCNRGAPASRFSRVAKPNEQTHQLSVDVVSMEGDAVDHTHPHGELTIGFAVEPNASPTFENRPPGWVFLPPGSRHVPHVEGGRMNLIYFLPDGAVEWHFDESQ